RAERVVSAAKPSRAGCASYQPTNSDKGQLWNAKNSLREVLASTRVELHRFISITGLVVALRSPYPRREYFPVAGYLGASGPPTRPGALQPQHENLGQHGRYSDATHIAPSYYAPTRGSISVYINHGKTSQKTGPTAYRSRPRGDRPATGRR